MPPLASGLSWFYPHPGSHAGFQRPEGGNRNVSLFFTRRFCPSFSPLSLLLSPRPAGLDPPSPPRRRPTPEAFPRPGLRRLQGQDRSLRGIHSSSPGRKNLGMGWHLLDAGSNGRLPENTARPYHGLRPGTKKNRSLRRRGCEGDRSERNLGMGRKELDPDSRGNRPEPQALHGHGLRPGGRENRPFRRDETRVDGPVFGHMGMGRQEVDPFESSFEPSGPFRPRHGLRHLPAEDSSLRRRAEGREELFGHLGVGWKKLETVVSFRFTPPPVFFVHGLRFQERPGRSFRGIGIILVSFGHMGMERKQLGQGVSFPRSSPPLLHRHDLRFPKGRERALRR